MSKRTENAESYLIGQASGDVEVALAAFAEDSNYWGIEKVDGEIRRRLYRGKDEIRGYIGSWLETAVGGITYQVDKTLEMDDGVFVFWSDEAEGQGEVYENSGVLVVEFHDDDSIRYVGAYNKSLEALRRWSFLDDKS